MAYTPPAGNAADLAFSGAYTPPAGDAANLVLGASGFSSQSLYPDGIASEAEGSATIVNRNRTLSPAGITGVFGTPVLIQTRFIVPSGLVGAFGTTTVRNQRQFLTPTGLTAGSIGGHTVADPHGTRTITATGFSTYALGAVLVSPRFVYAVGIGPINLGTPGVSRNPSPLGIDSLVFGSTDIAYRTKILSPAGIAAGVAGQPDVSDHHQNVYPSSLVQEAVFGDTGIKNQRLFLQPPGIDSFTSLSYSLVENYFKEIKPFGTDVSRYGTASLRNTADVLLPAGIDSFVFGRTSETGVGFRNRTIVPSGPNTLGTGSPTLTKTPSFAPVGFNAASYGTALVAPRVRTITGIGSDTSDYGSPTTWFRVRGFSGAGGSDLALYGTAVVDRLNRSVDLAGANLLASSIGTATVELRVRTLTVDGIGFDYGANRQFGTLRISDGTQRTTAIGLAAGTFGTLIIVRNERLLQPAGIAPLTGTPLVQLRTRYLGAHGGDMVLSGLAAVHNSRQYVRQAEGSFELAWGLPYAENRNKVIHAYGTDTSRLTSGASVLNNARLVAPVSALGSFGTTAVTYRNRTVSPLGLDGAVPSYWAALRNTRTILEPSGIGRGRLGVPRVWDDTQHIDCNGGVNVFTSYGTPTVAARVRSLVVDRFGVAPPTWPLPYVGLRQQYVLPLGSEGSFGAPFLEHHRNIIAMFGADFARYGEPAVRNNTPQLYVGSQEPPTNPQRPWVSFRVRSLAAQTFNAPTFGTAFVSPRTRYIGAAGINSLKIPLLHRLDFDAPVIPADQRVLPGGVHDGAVGNPTTSRRNVFPDGFISTEWGVPFITSTVLYPSSCILVDSEQVPAPRIIGPQYVTCFSGEANDTQVRGWIGMPAQYGSATIYPYYLRISEDSIGELVLKEGLIDYELTDGSNLYARPFFGSPSVELRNRRVTATHPYDEFEGKVEQPTVTLRVRTLLVDGLLSQRFGFPELPSGGQITPYWGRDTEDWIEGGDYDTAAYGTATVSRPVVYDPNVRPFGVETPEINPPRVELRNRVVAPSGALSAFLAGLPRVHPPEPIVPAGFIGDVGVPGISYFVRTVSPPSIDSFETDYEPGSFDFGVMTVRHKNQLFPMGLLASTIPAPIVILPDLGAVATLGDQSAYGRPRVGACAC